MTDLALQGIARHWICKVIDDLLVIGHDEQQCFVRLRTMLNVMRRDGIIASLRKLKEGRRLPWLGFIIESEYNGSPIKISPDPMKVKAIKSYPVPLSKTELQCFLGLKT